VEPKRIVLFVLIFAAVGGYWYFSQPSPDQPQKLSAADMDSIPAADRPSITNQKDTTDTVPDPRGEALSPGTAMIKSTILSVEHAGGQPAAVTIRVDEVLGYGSATPPLPAGTELELNVKGYLESNPELREQIQQDAEVQLLLASQQGLAVEGSTNQQRWSLVELTQ